MGIVVILAHPIKGSFNHAIAQTVVRTLTGNKHAFAFHDLYEEQFNPILPGNEIPEDVDIDKGIEKYCSELQKAEGIIVIHPNWWGQPPAILKGWIDRIFRPGIAYKFFEGDMGEGIPYGLLKAKTALIFTTSNTPPQREQAVFGDPLETLWKNCIFQYCGVKTVHRKNFSLVVTSSLIQRKCWLDEVKEVVNNYFP